jgi:hypothetical protein
MLFEKVSVRKTVFINKDIIIDFYQILAERYNQPDP